MGGAGGNTYRNVRIGRNEERRAVDEGRAGRRLGVAVVGMGGAVATTAVAGVELLRGGLQSLDGLPLAAPDLRALSERAGLVGYTSLEFAGWDVYADDLAKAAS